MEATVKKRSYFRIFFSRFSPLSLVRSTNPGSLFERRLYLLGVYWSLSHARPRSQDLYSWERGWATPKLVSSWGLIFRPHPWPSHMGFSLGGRGILQDITSMDYSVHSYFHACTNLLSCNEILNIFIPQLETVSATDPDERGNGQFRYSIENGDPDDQFAIDGMNASVTNPLTQRRANFKTQLCFYG